MHYRGFYRSQTSHAMKTTFHTLYRRLRGDRSPRTQRDRAVAEQLYAMLEETIDLAGASGLQFYVVDGTVTVVGTMASSRDRAFMLSLIEEVPGVAEVRSNVTLAGQHVAEMQSTPLVPTS